MKYVFIVVLFPLLVEIIPVLHVFDEEARGNNKERTSVDLWNALKRHPKPLQVHVHHQLLWKTQACELRFSLDCNAGHLLLLWPQWGSGHVDKLTKWNKCKQPLSGKKSSNAFWSFWVLLCGPFNSPMMNGSSNHSCASFSMLPPKVSRPKPLREIFPSCWRDRPSVQVELLLLHLSTWTSTYICKMLPQSVCLPSRWWPQHQERQDLGNPLLKVCVPSLCLATKVQEPGVKSTAGTMPSQTKNIYMDSSKNRQSTIIISHLYLWLSSFLYISSWPQPVKAGDCPLQSLTSSFLPQGGFSYSLSHLAHAGGFSWFSLGCTKHFEMSLIFFIALYKWMNDWLMDWVFESNLTALKLSEVVAGLQGK